MLTWSIFAGPVTFDNILGDFVYYTHTGASASKSKDSTDWQLIGGLIGGGVVLLLILAVMVVIFRPRQQPRQRYDDGTMLVSNVYSYILELFFTVDNVPLIQQQHNPSDPDSSEVVLFAPQQPESSTTSLGNYPSYISITTGPYHIYILYILRIDNLAY